MSLMKDASASTFVQFEGRWQFSGEKATFLGPDERGTPVGVCIFPYPFRSGTITAQIRLQKGDQTDLGAGRILIGYNVATGGYYSIGLGGYGFAYVADEFTPGRGWRALEGKGAASQLAIGRPYRLRAVVAGQHVSLLVDDVAVLETALPMPLTGNQAGLFAWGTNPIEFSQIDVTPDRPRIFVIMQFGEPYDDLYREVIQAVSDRLGFSVLRADDVFRPGVILQDIRQGIIEADVVVAEITPVNANVFYELGYAHALNKPTILLANRNASELPFDISGYRVIFYDDTIRGKRGIEIALQQHLENVGRALRTA